MPFRRAVLAALLLVLTLPALAAGEYTEGSARWEFTADRARQPHPAHLETFVVVPADMPHAVVCARYQNDLPNGERGRVETVIRFDRANGGQGSFRELTHVSSHVALPPCVNLSQGLTRGDLVTFTFDMSRFQKLKRKRHDTFSVFGGVFPDEASAQRGMERSLSRP